MYDEKHIKQHKPLFNLDKLWEYGAKPIEFLDYIHDCIEPKIAARAYAYRLLDYNKWYDKYLCWVYEKFYIGEYYGRRSIIRNFPKHKTNKKSYR